MWKSTYFWTLLCDDGIHLNYFVKGCFFLPSRQSGPISTREGENKLFGTKAFKSPCLALRIDFDLTERLWAFVRPPGGIVLLASLRGLSGMCSQV